MKIFWIVNFLCIFAGLSANNLCPTKDDVILLNDIQDAAIASEMIYKQKNFEINSLIEGTKFKIIQVHDMKLFVDDAYGIKVGVAKDGDTKMVVYRGTKGLDQLLQQAKSRFVDKDHKITINGSTAHVMNYFFQAFNLSFNDIKPYLKDPTKKYILTGHSLGGALASILAFAMTQEYNGSCWTNPKSSLITFGMPRVGRRDWAYLHDELIPTFRKLRFVYLSDMVTRIPGRLEGWVHPSRAVYIGKDPHIVLKRKRRFLSETPYWQICHNLEDFKCTHDLLTVPNAKHHSMTEYYEVIMNPPNSFRTKAGSELKNVEDMILTACSEPESYGLKSSGMIQNSYIILTILLLLVEIASIY